MAVCYVSPVEDLVIHYVVFMECLQTLAYCKEDKDHWSYVGGRDRSRNPPRSRKQALYAVHTNKPIGFYNVLVQVCGYTDQYGTRNCMNPEHMTVVVQAPDKQT